MYLTVTSSFLISLVMEGSGPSMVIKFLKGRWKREKWGVGKKSNAR
jgi:hypothetical protein